MKAGLDDDNNKNNEWFVIMEDDMFIPYNINYDELIKE